MIFRVLEEVKIRMTDISLPNPTKSKMEQINESRYQNGMTQMRFQPVLRLKMFLSRRFFPINVRKKCLIIRTPKGKERYCNFSI